MAGPLDWLQQLLGGEAPPSSIDQAPSDTGPRALQYLQDVMSGRIAANALPNTYDTNASFAQNVRNPAGIQQAMDVAMGVSGPGLAIKAYHASPYDFERFDIGKVGTGQGAAAYGHGLYAAESPAVSGAGGQYDREFTLKNLGKQDFNQGEEQIFRSLAAGKSDLDILGEMARGGGYTFDEASQTLNRMRAAKAKIYETQINAEPEHFLDWDKKLSEQSDFVTAAIRQRYPNLDLSSVPTEALAARGPADKLREAGIPGIRYLDQGSRQYQLVRPRITGHDWAVEDFRGQIVAKMPTQDEAEAWMAKNQTSNYVVFDDKLIEIRRKYGIVPPLAAGGLLGVEPPT